MRAYPVAIAFFGLLPTMAACASGGVPAARGEPAPDPAALVAELRAGSTPGAPRQINFAWSLEERGSRARGRGVVRAEAPERIRLDLFGPRGETYLVAGLVGAEYHLPPGAEAPVALPSPSLLWAAMGIFEPPRGATLTSANIAADGAEIRYSAPDDYLFLFNFVAGEGSSGRLASVERATSRGVVESVTVRRDSGGAVVRADYRDWSAFRDLTLEIESSRDADPFPPGIWRPDAEAR